MPNPTAGNGFNRVIAHLSGSLLEKKPDLAIVEVQGVGYAVQIPLSTFYQLGEPGSATRLKIHTHVREDTISLFGFLTEKEKEMFEKLIGISGIGPKLANNILSGASVDDLASYLKSGDVSRLTRIPGIGKKTAERMVLELRDKMQSFAVESAASRPAAAGRMRDDMLSALINLGYQKASAERALDAVMESAPGEPSSFETLLRAVLRRMSGGA